MFLKKGSWITTKRDHQVWKMCVLQILLHFISTLSLKKLQTWVKMNMKVLHSSFPKKLQMSQVNEKSTKPRVVPYHCYSAAQGPDSFYRELIMLYKLWRNEEEELINVNCHEVHLAHPFLI